MPNATSCPGGRWREPSYAIVGPESIHRCSVTEVGTGLVLHVGAIACDRSITGDNRLPI